MTDRAERSLRPSRAVLALLFLVVADVGVLALVLDDREPSAVISPTERAALTVALPAGASIDVPGAAAGPAPASPESSDPAPEPTAPAAEVPEPPAAEVPEPPAEPRPVSAPGLSDPVLSLTETDDGPVAVQEPGQGCAGHQVWRRPSPSSGWVRPGCLPAVGLPDAAAVAAVFPTPDEGVVSARRSDGSVVVFRTDDGGTTWSTD